MKCTYADTDCTGVPDGDRRWQCPVLDAALTQPLTDLCRTRPKYFEKWKAQGGPAHGGAIDPSNRLRLKIVAQPPECPFAAVVCELSRARQIGPAVDRLQRCREAQCGMLLPHKKSGQMVCVGRGRSCSWRRAWVAFLIGRADCPHWKTECKCR